MAQKSAPSLLVAYALLVLGAIALMMSIVYSSSILAIIGLGLTFWGAILLFIRPTRYVKAQLLEAALSSLTTVDQIITDLKYCGKAIYLPPRYYRSPKSGIVFIPSKEGFCIPSVEQVAEGKVFIENPRGICLTPAGLDLANLYENELRKDFARVPLKYLQEKLPKLFEEDLEIANDMEMSIESDEIKVRITGSIFENLCKEARKLSSICGSFGCPLCSSIAVALTRTTGNPVIIEESKQSLDSKTIETYYRILGK